LTGGYDANGRLANVTYPSGFIAHYAYNALGYSNQMSDGTTSQVHWTLNALDAEQHITQQTAGNSLLTTRGFDAATGCLVLVQAGSRNSVQNHAYTYNLLGNPLSRTDANTGLSESFTYHALNRLTSATLSTSVAPAKTFGYDAIGNLTSKSDVGSYSYLPRPHAVTSISGSIISTTYTYDANGNQTSGQGRTTTWRSYNKPASITEGATTISFQDDPAHQRFKQVTPSGTTLYFDAFGVHTELVIGSGTARWSDLPNSSCLLGSLRRIRRRAQACKLHNMIAFYVIAICRCKSRGLVLSTNGALARIKMRATPIRFEFASLSQA
jgi:YD repeat-containing protein